MIGILLQGKAQFPAEEGWERFNNYSISSDWEIADWDELFDKAHSLGVSVLHQDGEVYMQKGDQNGAWFFTNNGGLNMALLFLEGV